MQALTLFVDLDGVLADFDGGVLKVTGRLPRDQEPKRMWPALARTPGFYDGLDWLPDGWRLWEALKRFKPTILTGLPMGNWAKPQKLAWCRRELGPEVPVVACLSREKARRGRELTPSGSVPVLIDDRESLREAWEEMDGVFILHASAAESLAEFSRRFPEASKEMIEE